MRLLAVLASVPLLLDLLGRVKARFQRYYQEYECIEAKRLSFGRLYYSYPEGFMRRYVSLRVPGLHWEWDLRMRRYEWHVMMLLWVSGQGWFIHYIPKRETCDHQTSD
jgi:hypothetical protein